jgi:hypothetical protein
MVSRRPYTPSGSNRNTCYDIKNYMAKTEEELEKVINED